MSKNTLNTVVTVVVVLVLMALAMRADAQVTTTLKVPCTNENYETSPYCKAAPAYFIVDENGEAWGYLISGAYFTQTNVANDLGERLQRYNLERAYWYVSDKGDFKAETDLQALSIYLTL